MGPRPTHDVIRTAALATLAASLVASGALLAIDLPDTLSPSSPPVDAIWTLVLGLVPLGVYSFFITLWLLPLCVSLRWLMIGRALVGRTAVALVVVIAALAGCSTLYGLLAMFSPPPTLDSITRKLPSMLACVLYVTTWFVTLSWRSGDAYAHVPLTQQPALTDRRTRARRTTVETFVMLGVAGYCAIVGGIGGGLSDFWGSGDYHLESSTPSPSGSAVAHYAVYRSPGGAIGDSDYQIYLLKPGEPWSAEKRGLFLWDSEHPEVTRVEWHSDHELTIHVIEPFSSRYRGNAQEYSREGYVVRTEREPRPPAEAGFNH